MAVPKKKMSRSRRGSRRSSWVKKLGKQVSLALTLGNSIVSSNTSFIYLEKN